MKFIAIASLGFAALVAAQNSTSPAAGSDCVKADNACRSGPDANQSTCSSNKAKCQGQCYDTYNVCRVGVDANQALCASDFATCLGENPFDSNGSLTIKPEYGPGYVPTMAIATNGAAATPVSNASNSTATGAKPPTFTGGASHLAGAGSGLVAAVAGAIMLL